VQSAIGTGVFEQKWLEMPVEWRVSDLKSQTVMSKHERGKKV
jgi:hypothetical protein